MSPVRTILLACAAALLFTGTAPAGTVPAWHWARGHIRFLEDRGVLQPAFRSVKPYSHAQLRRLCAQADRSDLAPEEAAMLDRLAAYAVMGDSAGVTFGINGGFNYEERSEGWVNPVLGFGFLPGLSLQTSFKVRNDYEERYDGKEFVGMNAWNDQSMLLYEAGALRMMVGRDYLRLGPGRYGQLLLSSASPAFDQYRVDLRRGHVGYAFWGVALDERNGAARFMNGHRLSLALPGRVELGFNEMVIYGGPDAHMELTYMNPVLFYHGYALNIADWINTLLSLDADWQARPDLRCWMAFLVDDFQIEKSKPSELEPNELGITVGSAYSGVPGQGTVSLEFTQVRHRTYNAPQHDWEKYLHRNMPTGYYLPASDSTASNDFQALTLGWEQWWHPRVATEVAYRLVRRGEGTVQDTFNTDYLAYTIAEGYDEAIPFGTVETANEFSVGVELAWAAWLHARMGVTYVLRVNPGNVAGAADESGVRGAVKLFLGYRAR